jgi:hypothetical protein
MKPCPFCGNERDQKVDLQAYECGNQKSTHEGKCGSSDPTAIRHLPKHHSMRDDFRELNRSPARPKVTRGKILK